MGSYAEFPAERVRDACDTYILYVNNLFDKKFEMAVKKNMEKLRWNFPFLNLKFVPPTRGEAEADVEATDEYRMLHMWLRNELYTARQLRNLANEAYHGGTGNPPTVFVDIKMADILSLGDQNG